MTHDEISVITSWMERLDRRLSNLENKLDIYVTKTSCDECKKRWLDRRGVVAYGLAFVTLVGIMANLDKLAHLAGG